MVATRMNACWGGGAHCGESPAGRVGRYLTRRSLHSLVSLAGLIVLVFFLARLTGDPTNLYLPLDASLRARAELAKKHGFNDPLLKTPPRSWPSRIL